MDILSNEKSWKLCLWVDFQIPVLFLFTVQQIDILNLKLDIANGSNNLKFLWKTAHII